MERERGWWSADLEGGMEKLAVEGGLSVAASGSKNSDGKAAHWSTQTVCEIGCNRKTGNEWGHH